MVQKKLATLNFNVYSSQSVRPWLEVKQVLHYDSKQYSPETLQANLLKRNHDDPLTEHFGMKKTLELLTHRDYWSQVGSDIEKCTSLASHSQKSKDCFTITVNHTVR